MLEIILVGLILFSGIFAYSQLIIGEFKVFKSEKSVNAFTNVCCLMMGIMFASCIAIGIYEIFF